ncbi:MAG: hypothetical protein FJ267_07895 [Planctomycetes bacterium]|nr:hypothetical protein [Planctomycetota bacterium]
MIQLLAVKEQIATGLPTTHSSAALAIQAIHDVFHHWSEIPVRGKSLKSKLKQGVVDQYKRTKNLNKLVTVLTTKIKLMLINRSSSQLQKTQTPTRTMPCTLHVTESLPALPRGAT